MVFYWSRQRGMVSGSSDSDPPVLGPTIPGPLACVRQYCTADVIMRA